MRSKDGYARQGMYERRPDAFEVTAAARRRGADAHVSRTEKKWPEHRHYPWSVWVRESFYRDMVREERKAKP